MEAGKDLCPGLGPDLDPGVVPDQGDSGNSDTAKAAVEEAKLLMKADVIKFCDEHKIHLCDLQVGLQDCERPRAP